MRWLLTIVVSLIALATAASEPKQKSALSAGGSKPLVTGTSDGGVADAGATLAGGFVFGQVMRAKGDLSKDEIKTVVKAHNRKIGACYQKLLERNASKQPVPQGTATLKFTVDQEGRVADAAIAPGGLDDPTLASCIVERVLAWTFPKPRGEGPVKVDRKSTRLNSSHSQIS